MKSKTTKCLNRHYKISYARTCFRTIAIPESSSRLRNIYCSISWWMITPVYCAFVNDSIKTAILFLEPETTISSGSELFIQAGSTINLTCTVRHTPEPPTSITWTHGEQVINKTLAIGTHSYRYSFDVIRGQLRNIRMFF